LFPGNDAYQASLHASVWSKDTLLDVNCMRLMAKVTVALP